jgi:hypothetical protein
MCAVTDRVILHISPSAAQLNAASAGRLTNISTPHLKHEHIEEYRLLGCDAFDTVWFLWEPTFRRKGAPPARNVSSSFRSVLRFLVTASVVPSSPILVTVMMEAIGSSETSVLTKTTRRHIPEGGILHRHRRESLSSYLALTGWAL